MNLVPVQSSNIEAIGHDPETSTMEVKFRSGGSYTYPGVTEAEHAAFLAAPSLGSHFHQHFKRRPANRK